MANHFFHPDLTSGLGGHLSNMDISRLRTSPLSWVKQNEVNFNDGSFFGKTTNEKSAVSATSPRHKEMPSFQHSYQVLGSLTQMKMIPMKATRGLRHLGPGWECEKPVMTCGRSRLVWKDLTLILTAPRNVFEYSTRFGLQSYETFQFVRDNDRDQSIYPARLCRVALLWTSQNSQISLAVSQDDAEKYQCAGGGP